MIVKDKEKILIKANEIVYRLYDIISETAGGYTGEDDGCEIIYLMMHISSIFAAKMKMLMKTYSMIYGVEVPFDEWFSELNREYYQFLEEDHGEKIKQLYKSKEH